MRPTHAPAAKPMVNDERLPAAQYGGVFLLREFILATRHEKIILRAMRQWIATLLLIVGGSCWAADAIVKDGDTLILGDTSYKLDGIDAPEPDQVCLDEKGTIWRCGIEARDRLAKLIDSRTVLCVGFVCFEPYAKGRF